MNDSYYSGSFEDVRSKSENLLNEIIILKQRLIGASGLVSEGIKLDITSNNTELRILNNKMEYHRLNAFVDVAKGMIDKELYLKIWEEVGKKVPEIISDGRKAQKKLRKI